MWELTHFTIMIMTGLVLCLSVSGAVDGAFEKLYIGINTLTVGWAQQFDAI